VARSTDVRPDISHRAVDCSEMLKVYGTIRFRDFQKHIHINYINDCGFGEPPVFVTITIYQFEIFAFLSASLAKQNWT